MECDHNNLLFNGELANSYDAQRNKLAPIKDALHLCSKFFLSELAEDAQILCVGVGTGEELIYLAREYPGWNFTAIDPSPDMLEKCHNRLTLSGFESRCTLYEGYLHTLDNNARYDGATSILVSHFLVDKKDRIQYFSDIHKRLRSGGLLLNADIASNVPDEYFQSLLKGWIKMHEYAQMNIDINDFGKKVSLLPINEIENLILESGFNSAMHFYQAILINAWLCRKA